MAIQAVSFRKKGETSEESPVYKHNHDERQSTNGTILLHQQFPIDPHCRLPVLSTILPQSGTNFTHTLQAVTPIQQILDILRHDLCHVSQLIVQLIKVLGGAGIGVGGFCPRDESVEFHERVGAERRGEGLRNGVGGAELGGEVGEVGKG